MAEPINMPRLGFDMVEGTIVRWLKGEGESVAEGEVIAEVETDKAIVELEAPMGGTLLAIAAPEGALVPVDGVVAYIGSVGEVTPTSAPPAPSPPVSSVARRIAAEHGIDPATLTATGPQGRVSKQDVQEAVARLDRPAPGLRTGFPPRLPDSDGKIVLGPMGKAIARRTAATAREIPHFYVNMSIDMTTALELRRQLNQANRGGTRISLNDMVIRAAVLTLQKYPVFNSAYEGDHLQVHPHINIGIAVAMAQGLMVPAITNCEAMSLAEIALASRDVASRAADGTLRQAEYTGTFSVSNLGMYGIDSFTQIIVAPQVAVLGVAGTKPMPVVVANEIVVRHTMTATLGIDHRAAHGAEGAQFLVELKRLLESPQLLVD